MAKSWIAVSAVLLAVAPSLAVAHTGHGSDGGSYSLSHYFTEPVHALASLVIMAALTTGFAVLRRFRRRLGPSPEKRAA